MRTALPWLRVPALAVTVMAIAALPAASAAATHPVHGTRLKSQQARGAGTMTTVAGGVGGPAKATAIALGYPCGIASSAGNLYVAQTTVVRRVAEATDELTSPVGVGRATSTRSLAMAYAAMPETAVRPSRPNCAFRTRLPSIGQATC